MTDPLELFLLFASSLYCLPGDLGDFAGESLKVTDFLGELLRFFLLECFEFVLLDFLLDDDDDGDDLRVSSLMFLKIFLFKLIFLFFAGDEDDEDDLDGNKPEVLLRVPVIE